MKDTKVVLIKQDLMTNTVESWYIVLVNQSRKCMQSAQVQAWITYCTTTNPFIAVLSVNMLRVFVSEESKKSTIRWKQTETLNKEWFSITCICSQSIDYSVIWCLSHAPFENSLIHSIKF